LKGRPRGKGEALSMNVLICTFSFPSPRNNVHDGKFVFSEAMAYAEAGAEVRVLTPHFKGALRHERMCQGLSVHRVTYFLPRTLQVLKRPGQPIYRQKSFLAVFQVPFLCLSFFLAILRHARWADIIHAQWTHTALLALPAKWFLGKKVVLTARGSDIRLIPGWLNRFIHRNVDGAIDCFGPQPWNEELKKKFPARYIPVPLIVHPGRSNGMPEDMKCRLSPKKDPFVVLYVGRFDRIKLEQNHLPLFELVHAAGLLKSAGRDFHIFYIGGGDRGIEGRLERAIRDHDVQDVVTWLGPKVNVLDYMRFCHLGVGGIAFNGVSQEFTINGKPQILMRGRDNTHTPWNDGINALFVMPGDPQGVAERLLWAMDHREELEKMGKRARKDMKPYMVDSRCGGRIYLAAFDRLIKGD